MRNYNDIPPELQRRIVSEFQSNKVDFQGIEATYGVSAVSVYEYLNASNRNRFEAFSPPIVEYRQSWIIWLKKSGSYELMKQLAMSVFLLWALVSSTELWAWVGIDPLNNDLISTAPKAGFFCVVAKMFVDIFWWVLYKTKFRYLNPHIKTGEDYYADFQNLTPYQRWLYVSLKYYFWLAMFCYLLATLNPMQSAPASLMLP